MPHTSESSNRQADMIHMHIHIDIDEFDANIYFPFPT